MHPTEITEDIIIAMINNNLVTTTEQISQAYKDVYSIVIKYM